jgi:hypothetical protein
VNPRWACRQCGNHVDITGETIRDRDYAKAQLINGVCKNLGHVSKPYYIAGVRL